VELEFSNFVIINANYVRYCLMARSRSCSVHSAMNGMCIQVSERFSDVLAGRLMLAITANLMLISFVAGRRKRHMLAAKCCVTQMK
jgi:hypothetical protein